MKRVLRFTATCLLGVALGAVATYVLLDGLGDAPVMVAVAKPRLSAGELCREMEDQGGLHCEELAKQVRWYLDRRNPDNDPDIAGEMTAIAGQLMANLADEVTMVDGSIVRRVRFIKGLSYDMLVEYGRKNPVVQGMLSTALWAAYRYAEPDPDFAYLMFNLTSGRPVGQFNELVFTYLDLLAYMRAYLLYRELDPAASQLAADQIRAYWFPGFGNMGHNTLHIDKALSVAESQGAVAGANLLMDQLTSNFRDSHIFHPHLRTRTFRAGWPHTVGEVWISIEQSDVADTTLSIPLIQEVDSVRVNGIEVHDWTHDSDAKVLTIPVREDARDIYARVVYAEERWMMQAFPYAFHGGVQPHEHLRGFDSQGRPISEETVRQVPREN